MERKNISHFRHNIPNQSTECYHLKVLIPNDAVGSIIGKNGSKIKRYEQTYCAKIEISCFDDVYPGTNDRVALISGDINSILSINDFIMVQVSKMPDSFDNLCFDYYRKIYFERNKQVKFLVPQISAAKLIGRCGYVINRMKLLSGSFIQISQFSPDLKLDERCVIVAGDLENNKKACRMIFNIIAADTRIPFYKNICYSELNYPIPSAFPTGPALANTGKFYSTTETSKEICESCHLPNCFIEDATLPKPLSEFLDSVAIVLRKKAYSDSVITKAKEAFCYLVHNDVLSVCSSVIIDFFDSVSPPAESETGKITNIPGNASVPFSDTSTMKPIISSAQNQGRSSVKPDLQGYFTCSSSTSEGNHDVASLNTINVPVNTSAPTSDTSIIRPFFSSAQNQGRSSVKSDLQGYFACSSSTNGGNQGVASLNTINVPENASVPTTDTPIIRLVFPSVQNQGGKFVKPRLQGNFTSSTCGDNRSTVTLNATNVPGNASVPFSDTPKIRPIFSNTSNHDLNFVKPGLQGNFTSSTSEGNRDAATFNITNVPVNACVPFSDTPIITPVFSAAQNQCGNLVKLGLQGNFASSATSGRNRSGGATVNTTNVPVNACVPFCDTPIIRPVFPRAQNQSGNFVKPGLQGNFASSSTASGENQSAVTLNAMSLWNHLPNPLVSINNCAHISVPNCHPGSSELFHEDFPYSMFPGMNFGTKAPDVGNNFM